MASHLPSSTHTFQNQEFGKRQCVQTERSGEGREVWGNKWSMYFSLILIRTLLGKIKTQFQNKSHRLPLKPYSSHWEWAKSQVNCQPPYPPPQRAGFWILAKEKRELLWELYLRSSLCKKLTSSNQAVGSRMSFFILQFMYLLSSNRASNPVFLMVLGPGPKDICVSSLAYRGPQT